ncbi:unnamed protein product [Cunninghamella echinulata]
MQNYFQQVNSKLWDFNEVARQIMKYNPELHIEDVANDNNDEYAQKSIDNWRSISNKLKAWYEIANNQQQNNSLLPASTNNIFSNIGGVNFNHVEKSNINVSSNEITNDIDKNNEDNKEQVQPQQSLGKIKKNCNDKIDQFFNSPDGENNLELLNSINKNSEDKEDNIQRKRTLDDILDNDDNAPFLDRNENASVFQLPALPVHLENIDIDTYPTPNSNSRWIIKNKDISLLWHNFKLESLQMAKTSGLYLESDYQHILSLSHICLLKPNESSSIFFSTFDETTINNIMNDLNNKFGIGTHEFDETLFIKINKLLKEVIKKKKDVDTAAYEIHGLGLNLHDGDHVVVYIIKNLLETLVDRNLKNDISEAELCGGYLDPILRTLFNRRKSNHRFRWYDKHINGVTTKKKPDAVGNIVQQSQWGPYVLFGEVKIEKMKTNTYELVYDLVRLAQFSKQSIDISKMNGVLCFQAVGFTITFYFVNLLYDGFYVMFPIGKINVPKSIMDIPSILLSADVLLDVYNIYHQYCIPTDDPTSLEEKTKPSLSTPDFKELVYTSKNRKRTCNLVFN